MRQWQVTVPIPGEDGSTWIWETGDPSGLWGYLLFLAQTEPNLDTFVEWLET